VEAKLFDARNQIGLSGRTVRPKLIITLGISGAVQFLAGMQSSDYIIAVNTDPNAPVFSVAHAAVIADYREVLPQLLERMDAGR
jgi:electron transfer flavoprotein alpha subunit